AESLPGDQQVETNVRRFYESVQERAPDGVEQIKWYDQGVGTHWYDRFSGGTIGAGLPARNAMSAAATRTAAFPT
ncbi:MAG: phospholipase effector Tle1 domain-containing protein, partial [Candidatus Binatia bacterium]